jgi:uncharacterized repeat protein (TIGR03803 family)
VGTIFRISLSGTLTTLHSFCSDSGCTDGQSAYAGLIQAAGGSLYGTTSTGGANNAGTIYRITPGGTLTTVYSFCSQSRCTDGSTPIGGVIQATRGDFYGTTYSGGATDFGTIFRITFGGTLTTLYSFCALRGCVDGNLPSGALLKDTDGKFYGRTAGGGYIEEYDFGPCGTVFTLSLGLGPFVETEPASGNVGAVVKILGTNLSGASSVTFNGTPAMFGVARPSEIIAAVPAGATTGTVQVVTPNGTLSSNVLFQVP